MATYDISLRPSAIEDMDRIRSYERTQIADAMEACLMTEPTRESGSRIKRLRGMSDPDYRLRVGDWRVFYNVDGMTRRVDVLRVMHKDQTYEYYKEHGS